MKLSTNKLRLVEYKDRLILVENILKPSIPNNRLKKLKLSMISLINNNVESS